MLHYHLGMLHFIHRCIAILCVKDASAATFDVGRVLLRLLRTALNVCCCPVPGGSC